MKYRQWKKNYKKKYGANPPFELDKRKQRRYARKMARQINITLPTMMETLTKAEEKIQTLDTQVLLLIAMNNMIDDYTGDLVEYSGEYKEDAGKRYQEGLKVNLCLEHHRNGPAAVHNNAKNARILMAKAQEVYERTHTREEWMKNAGKNYL